MSTKSTSIFKGKPLFSWKSTSFLEHQRGVIWHLSGGLVALAITAYAMFYEDSWSMATVALVAYLVLLLYMNEKPKTIENSITEKGVVSDGKILFYEELRSFWFVSDTDYHVLKIEKSGGFGTMHIQIPQDAVEKIRALLAKHIPENTKRKEPLFEYFIRKLKM